MGINFHNKFHRHNHHTRPTIGEFDSAKDPIASPEDPFKGSVNIVGDLYIHGNLDAKGAFRPNSVDGLDYATTETEGVIRYATSYDLATDAGDVAITPADVAVLMETEFGVHKIVGSDSELMHTDVCDDVPPATNNMLVYISSTGKWTPSGEFVIDPYPKASADQATGVVTTGNEEVYVSPPQMHAAMSRSFNITSNFTNYPGTYHTLALSWREAGSAGEWTFNGLTIDRR